MRKLQWETCALNLFNDLRVGFRAGIAVRMAASPIGNGTYAVVKMDSDGQFAPWLGGAPIAPSAPTIEGAQLAVQMHLAEAILSALEPIHE